ncbi:alpha/beta hydrolase [candidate division CSSED10-310 bacterium]|uniref:Alpha/beta hydrolase n=1 Tax=candidate division CSSED10-310 bacterium TaxID=2855610 RepID=A0ABV6YXU5_UNCC1
MAEERIFFSSGSLQIEGLLGPQSGDKGVVITHPHPLFGGSMFNHVVETMTEVYQQKGYSTLRFNFRGTGKSQGRFDEGIGEQGDVEAAVRFLTDKGCENIDLAGYSFGAWVNALTTQKDLAIQNMIMVSPPVAFFSFQAVTRCSSLKLVITGSADEIAPAATIKKDLLHWNPDARLAIIQGADHFYTGCTAELARLLSSG